MTQGSVSIELAADPVRVWTVLTSPGVRDWYYGLAPEGEFQAGREIRWRQAAGEVGEESRVVEATAPHRLELRTRYVFAPALAAAEAHTVTWQIAPAGDGSRVELGWSGDGPGVRMLAAGAENQLRALRLEVEPEARVELARLPEIGPVEIHDVTPDRVGDYHRFFDEDAFRDFPTWQDCYCLEPHRGPSEEDWGRTGADNRRDMTALITDRAVTALLAYAGGKPVGWCNYGETTRFAGVMHRFGLDAGEHSGVGSIACFVIAAPYRGHGVATALLEAALERLRERGVKVAEAYPATSADSQQVNFRGPLQMYLKAGFAPYREAGRSLIVRKPLE